MLDQEYPVIGDWLFLHFTENKGMAFGLEFSGVVGKYILSIIRIIAIVAISRFIYYVDKKKVSRGTLLCLTLVLAGAIGNILDSAFYGLVFTDSFGRVAELVAWGEGYAPFLQGKVVDMLYIEIFNFHLPEWFPFWSNRHVIFFRPIFNIADVAITSGILFLLVFKRKEFNWEKFRLIFIK